MRTSLRVALSRVSDAAAAALGPLAVLAVLAAVDILSNGSAPFAGVAVGMALMGIFGLLATWRIGPEARAASAVRSALRSAAEGALGVVLVFLLAAPLTLLLPVNWSARLTGDERATDLMVLLLMGMTLIVAARAWSRAERAAALEAEAERDAANVRAELAERERRLVRTEMQLLRAQVEPHFLWNTLASLDYLIRTDAIRASQMLQLLVAYLRSTVAASQAAHTTLRSEFESVRAYLGLMQLRMGERLHTQLELAAGCEDVPFPPLVLQTLVENGIKHGLEPKVGQALLLVRAGPSRDKPDCMAIDVVDNGVGLQPSPSTAGGGLGLRNIRERLLAQYGDAASLELHANATGGVCARVEWRHKRDT
ncbi:MAG: histidine kinase [Proteobacteria bacterium]|nr:histidine kinase [Pseudomonadota bacterium]